MSSLLSHASSATLVATSSRALASVSLKKYDTDSYQVIYTTSYITESLDHSDYVVGEHYDMGHKSLKNVVKK